MNIKERRKILEVVLDARRFGIVKPPPKIDHGREDLLAKYLENLQVFTQLDHWASLKIPPMNTFFPYWVVDQLLQLSKDPALMNKPRERYQIMERDILNPYGFKILASGTNRRTFYYDYDPTIVLKVGSDRVGRSDNISEYYTQEILKPLCAKAYEFATEGVCMLSERAEAMTQAQYKSYSRIIFNIIMLFFYKGFIMEDIGSIFYKNWAIRIGKYPILIDHPYVYEIDWSRLRCEYRDPNTGERCNGDIDYDDLLTQLVCTKCGRRYSAKYLARAVPTAAIERFTKGKGKFKMSNFKISIFRGDEMVFSNYREANGIPNETQKRLSNRNNVHESKPAQPNEYARTHPIFDDVKIEVEKFLAEIERKFSKGAAIDLARRLNIYYNSPYDPKTSKQAQKAIENTYSKEPKKKDHLSRTEGENDEQKSNAVSSLNPNRQKSGLFPSKPLSSDEIEAMREKESNEMVAMGIPGEPMVNTMKLKTMIPEFKSRITDMLDNFESKGEDADNVSYLKEQISILLVDDVMKLTNVEKKDVDIDVQPTVDNRNNKCFAIRVSSKLSPLFDTIVYCHDEKAVKITEENKIDEDIYLTEKEDSVTVDADLIKKLNDSFNGNLTLNSVEEVVDEKTNEMINLQEDEYIGKDDELEDCCDERILKNAHPSNELSDKEQKKFYCRQLITDLMSYKKVPYAKAQKYATDYVNRKYPFKNKETISIQNEL